MRALLTSKKTCQTRLRYIHSLLVVFFNFIVDYDQIDACLLEQFFGVRVSVITFFTNHSFDAGIYYHHRTGSTRRHLAEKCCPFEGNAKPSRLNNRVLLSVKRANAVLRDIPVIINYLAHIVSNLVAVRQTCRCSNVTRGHYSLVFDYYTATSSSVACSAFCNSFAEVQEVPVPIRS
jgi:hypothetical protein